jgi:RND family efflux transporter MFP subunit
MNDSVKIAGESAASGSTSSRRLAWRFSLVAGVLGVGVLIAIVAHEPARASMDVASVPQVAVARVGTEDLFKEVRIPAEFRPYADVDVHAKVSGFVRKMYVDIGDRVKAGQLLAQLEVPELTDELDHATAALKRAEADYKAAHLAYQRLLAVNKEHPNLIAQQDLDTAESADASSSGTLAAARADVDKYRALVGYTRIAAPFGGVITKRYADPGALIQAGTSSNTQAMPLVRLSNNQRLRLDFPVPVDYVRGIHDDVPVTVQVDALSHAVTGKIARFSNAVDQSTRTMTVEMEVANDAFDIVPGMYATVLLKVDEHPHAVAVPIEAVRSGGKSVYVVDADHRIEERPIKVGLETPTKYEVLSGLKDGDLVAIGNLAQLRPKQQVEAKLTASLARE